MFRFCLLCCMPQHTTMALRQAGMLLSHAQRCSQLPQRQMVAAAANLQSALSDQAAAGIQHGSHLSGVSGLFARLFAHATTGQTARAFSQQAAGSGEAAAAAAAAEPSSSNAEGDGAEDAAGPSQADLQALLFSRDEEINQLKGQLNDLTDAYKRNLAEMENLRERTRREIDTAKKFAIQGFVKQLLDVADNMGRALEVVPPRQEAEQLDVERAVKLLTGLQEGVQATESILLSLLRQSGVEQYNPLGDPFDPNRHMAMFEVPDPTKEAGTVAVVTKRGYTMHDRVLRAAEVGVVKAPSS